MQIFLNLFKVMKHERVKLTVIVLCVESLFVVITDITQTATEQYSSWPAGANC